MIELDDRLLALRQEIRVLAEPLRERALDLEADPQAIKGYLDLPVMRFLASMLIPPEYQQARLRVGPYAYYGTECLERVVAAEEIARADAAALIAAPGPSLSGVLIAALADEAQKQWYYDRLLTRPTWTFFALTEPDRGSDAGRLSTCLRPSASGGWMLNGAKRYIGNGTRASLGAVIARQSDGPLGVTAVLIETGVPGFAATAIPTVGLRAAQLSAISLSDVAVTDDQVLGRHLSASRRGMRAVVQTLNQLRPGVAAIALGISAAAIDYARAHRAALRAWERHELEQFESQLTAARQLVYQAARSVGKDADNGALASAAKARAASLAEQVTLFAPRLFGPGARIDHPMLDKLARDARGTEFMEGTSSIQKLTLFSGYVRGRLAHA
jgi:alkylation response protein AidB-like acyl-CoA dehydrogenase